MKSYIEKVLSGIPSVQPHRRAVLDKIAAYIRAGKAAKLVFICTHNSRRSQFAQVWAAVAADYFDLKNVETYSGGTEATVFHPNAVAALHRAGFEIKNPGGENPHYELTFSKNRPALVCFSKTYSDPANPQKNFAAVMVCSDADEGCPVVFGAERRFSLPYADPKIADGRTDERATYDARCLEIAVEMFYLMSQVSKNG